MAFFWIHVICNLYRSSLSSASLPHDGQRWATPNLSKASVPGPVFETSRGVHKTPKDLHRCSCLKRPRSAVEALVWLVKPGVLSQQLLARVRNPCAQGRPATCMAQATENAELVSAAGIHFVRPPKLREPRDNGNPKVRYCSTKEAFEECCSMSSTTAMSAGLTIRDTVNTSQLAVRKHLLTNLSQIQSAKLGRHRDSPKHLLHDRCIFQLPGRCSLCFTIGLGWTTPVLETRSADTALKRGQSHTIQRI